MSKVMRIGLTAMLDAFANQRLPVPEVPAHVRLRPGDFPFWAETLKTRGRAEWAPLELPMVAQYARTMADYLKQSDLLDRERSVIRSPTGTPVPNPRCKVVNMLASRARALERALQMNMGPI